MRHISLGDLPAAAGTDLGTTDWLAIDQQRIDAFAQTTGDHQWIHVDTERAAASGGTIAHGLLLLSLIPAFTAQLLQVDGAAARINYGLDRVRFPASVPAGAAVRDHVTILQTEHRAGGLLAGLEHRIELRGGDKPACVAVTLTLFTPEPA